MCVYYLIYTIRTVHRISCAVISDIRLNDVYPQSHIGYVTINIA